MSTFETVDLPRESLRIETPRGVRFVPAPGFRNVALTLSYDGHAFQGYQVQPHAKTVQETLNRAWKILTGEDVILYGCSRLDAGVDAKHFVLNLHSAHRAEDEAIMRSLNGILHSNLKEPIAIYRVEEKPPAFNARFDASGKHYRYLVWYGRGQHALLTPRCWHLRSRAEPADLSRALAAFEGTHDFSAFRASDCTARNTIRTIQRISLARHPRFPELHVIDFWGEGFLKNMIRNIVGTAVDVSVGRFPLERIEDAFSHGQRARVGQCAPAHGLTLEEVFYDAQLYKDSARKGSSALL